MGFRKSTSSNVCERRQVIKGGFGDFTNGLPEKLEVAVKRIAPPISIFPEDRQCSGCHRGRGLTQFLQRIGGAAVAIEGED